MRLRTFVSEQSGITAMEYGLIAALIALAVILVLQLLGLQMEENYAEVSTVLDGAA